MLFLIREKTRLVEPGKALPGRADPMPVPDRHEVLGTPLTPPFPGGPERAIVGMGYHQQYLAKNPNGYCGLGGIGVACPVGLRT